jgi:protein tyrosine phosphatase (PTP) superfamily phosphohydrolase (DUF442 family)
MKSSPRSIRLSEDGLKALKILEVASPDSSRGETVSQALVFAANKALSARPVNFRLLDAAEYLSIQATLSEIESLHRKGREALLKLRPSEKDPAKKAADAINSIDVETAQLTRLRHRLAALARITAHLSAEDHKQMSNLIRWTEARIEKADEKNRPFYEFQLRILRSLIL